jgi:hypothetical protein
VSRFFVFCAVIFLVNPQVGSARGGEQTNGGDGVVADFYGALDMVIALMPPQLRYSESLSFKKDDFQNIRDRVFITSAPSVYVGQQEVMALNKPKSNPPEIVVSQRLWPVLGQENKYRLALHELLPIMGYADKGYSYSGWIAQRVMNLNKERSPAALFRSMRICDLWAIQNITWESLQLVIAQYSLAGMLEAGVLESCSPFYARIFEIGISPNVCFAEMGREGFSMTAFGYMLRGFLEIPDAVSSRRLFRESLYRMVELGADPQFKCHPNAPSACDILQQIDFGRVVNPERFDFLKERCER